VGILPHGDRLSASVVARLAEQHYEWAVQRRYMSLVKAQMWVIDTDPTVLDEEVFRH
jgi:hypothetical protein